MTDELRATFKAMGNDELAKAIVDSVGWIRLMRIWPAMGRYLDEEERRHVNMPNLSASRTLAFRRLFVEGGSKRAPEDVARDLAGEAGLYRTGEEDISHVVRLVEALCRT